LIKTNILTKSYFKDDYEDEIHRMVEITTVKNLLNVLDRNRTPNNVKARLISAVEKIKQSLNQET